MSWLDFLVVSAVSLACVLFFYRRPGDWIWLPRRRLSPKRRINKTEAVGFTIMGVVVIAIAGGIYWKIESENLIRKRVAGTDINLSNIISVSSLEGILGQHDSVDACRVPFENTLYTNCKRFGWNGVAELWVVQSDAGVAQMKFYQYQGTFCHESVEQVRLKKNACGLPIDLDDHGNVEYWNPRYHPKYGR